jgi:hypothetical protein
MTWVIVRDGDGSWGATALLSIVILVLFLLVTLLGHPLGKASDKQPLGSSICRVMT